MFLELLSNVTIVSFFMYLVKTFIAHSVVREISFRQVHNISFPQIPFQFGIGSIFFFFLWLKIYQCLNLC